MGACRRVGDDRARRAREDGLIEGDRDVRTERFLDRCRVLRREAMNGPIEVRAECDAVLVDDAQIAEGHDLESTRVREDRAVPIHEPMQPAEPGDPLVPRPEIQVVRVGEDDRGARVLEVVG
jgi:hypothetical protein